MKTLKTKKDLILQLEAIPNAKREYRDAAAAFVLKNKETFSYLVPLIFEGNKRINILATWVFELVCLQDLSLIQSHLDYFINSLQTVKHESQLRPISKICFKVIQSNYVKKEGIIKLSPQQKEVLAECNFDWMIENHKIATQVFAMDSLFLLGKELNWIHPELKLILQKDFQSKSPGYQAHARHLLQSLI